ncbi:MAG: protein kinase [Planctomycetales bacterium]|nr:protein kinase [Planctomycetales bacterium]
MKPLTTDDAGPTDADLDAYVEAFEDASDALGPDSLALFLPGREHPCFAAIAAEMVRVDLERRTRRGHAARLSDYREVVPGLFSDPAALANAAFEEYRLRRRGGEEVRPEQLARSYSIDVSDWPALKEVGAAPTLGLSHGEPPRAGEVFGGFQLVEELGRGAFGVVYLARQEELSSREVVLKITPRRSVEAQRLARLHHTNITPIYSLHAEGPWLGICMPYLGRRTLADFTRTEPHRDLASTLANQQDETVRMPTWSMRPRKPQSLADPKPQTRALPEQRGLALVGQLAEGLAHAHARGIVHSDVKPANVLIGDDGVARLLDFNLSADGTSTDVQTLMVGGTLPYLAPEHLVSLSHGAPAPPASDVYSLGVLLLQLVTGNPPQAILGDSSNLSELAARRRAFSIEQLDGLPLTPPVRQMLARALAPDPAARYTAAELAEDIARHCTDQTLKHVQEPWSRQSLHKWRRRNRVTLRWAGAAAMACAMLLAAFFAVHRGARLNQMEAARSFEAFQHDVLTARLLLHTPGHEPEIWSRGAEAARNALGRFGGPDNPSLALLSRQDQTMVSNQTRSLEHLLGELDARQNPDDSFQRPLGIAPDTSSSEPISMAASMVDMGDYDGVLRLLSSVRGDNASDPVRWLLLGNAQAALGRLPEAETAYTALVALQPEAMAGYYYRGLARLQSGRYALAVDDFTEASDRSPDTACILLNRAVAYRKLGVWKAAERDVTDALSVDDANPRAWLLRADLRKSQGDLQGAAADTQEGLQRQPTDELGWSARGLALLDRSPEAALKELRQGVERFPDSATLHKNLVHLLADQLLRSDEALPYARRLAEIRPDDLSAQLSLAVLLARTGDRQAAVEIISRLPLQHATPLDMLQLACVYGVTMSLDDADSAESLKWLRVALRRDPTLCLRAAKDSDLALLRDSREYQELMQASTRLSTLRPSGPARGRGARADQAAVELPADTHP